MSFFFDNIHLHQRRFATTAISSLTLMVKVLVITVGKRPRFFIWKHFNVCWFSFIQSLQYGTKLIVMESSWLTLPGSVAAMRYVVLNEPVYTFHDSDDLDLRIFLKYSYGSLTFNTRLLLSLPLLYNLHLGDFLPVSRNFSRCISCPHKLSDDSIFREKLPNASGWYSMDQSRRILRIEG